MRIKNLLHEQKPLPAADHSRDWHPASRLTKIVGSTLGLITFLLVATIPLRGEDRQLKVVKGDQSVSIQARIIEAPVGTVQQLVNGEEQDPNVPMIISGDQTNHILKCLCQMDSAAIISSPSVVTFSGKEALVQFGREVVPDPDDPKTEFVGISLKFLPTVEDNKDITLKIEAGITEQTGNIGKRTIIKRRKVESQSCIQAGGTMILLQEGGTKNGANMETIILISPKLVTEENYGKAADHAIMHKPAIKGAK